MRTRHLFYLITIAFFIFGIVNFIFSSFSIQNSKPIESIKKDPSPINWDKNIYPSEINIKNSLKILQSIKTNLSQRSPLDFFNNKWTTQGPANIGGRISAVAIDPNNNNIIYAGFSNGGIFKTTDNGQSWSPIFDQEVTLSIGAICIDPTNSQIIYVGTGDPDINGNSYIGYGLFKSINGGKTWSNIALNDVRVINEIIIDPTNSKTIYVAAMGNPFEVNSNRGVYKSIDSGNSWTKVLYVSDSAGISDIALSPRNSNIIYAASYHRIRTATYSRPEGPDSRIFRSIDGGQTWLPIMNGISKTDLSRIAIDVSNSDPNILYARCVKNHELCGNAGYNMEGLYKSTNGGDSWLKVNVDYNSIPCDFLGGFGWYFGKIAISPDNPNHLYLLAVELWESSDGGISWSNVDGQSNIGIHADKHILLFDKSKNIILGTDGGLYKYYRASSEWQDIENIPCTQFYRVAIDPNDSQFYYGGAQDNGTSYGNVKSINNWIHAWGGDGFQTVFHKSYPEFIWYETQYGSLYRIDRSNGNWDYFTDGINGTSNWDAPYFASSYNQDTMYFASDALYLNTSPIVSNWQKISPILTQNGPFPNRIIPTVSTMHESPLIRNKIIIGTTNGNIWLGNTLNNSYIKINSNLPPGYVTCVKASPFDSNTLYVAYSNYRNNDNTGYLFKSIDNGQTWKSIASKDLLSQPINDILILPETNDQIIIAGTVFGVYATIDGGSNWNRLGNNLPIIPVNCLAYNIQKKEIVAGSFARSILTYPIANLTSINEKIIEKEKIEFYSDHDFFKILGINNEDQHSLAYSIYNINGNEVSIGSTNDNTINIANLAQGIYIVKFKIDSQIYFKKFFKY